MFSPPVLSSASLRRLKTTPVMTADISSRLRLPARLAFAGITLTLTACTFTKAREKPAPPARQEADAAAVDKRRLQEMKKLLAVLPVDYKMETFNPAELNSLAEHPQTNPRRLMWLINHAGAERDTRFRGLLNREDLRRDPALDLALDGYDYSVNGSRRALERVLKSLAKEEPGSDAQAVVTLSFIDEWSLTPAAVQRHFVKADGAGGISKTMFWLRREHLFPENYRAFREKGR